MWPRLKFCLLLYRKCWQVYAHFEDQLLATHARRVLLLDGMDSKCGFIVAQCLAHLLDERL